MGLTTAPQPVKLFIGLITADSKILPNLLNLIKKIFGNTDKISPVIDFGFTQYYKPEMGTGLKRQFISFEKLIEPSKLSTIKLKTNLLEKKLSKDGKRVVNIDPGYIALSKVVLASTKDFSHRIYLGKGIFAEITLLYSKKEFKALDWTYPDFKTPLYQDFLLSIRQIYKKQIDEL